MTRRFSPKLLYLGRYVEGNTRQHFITLSMVEEVRDLATVFNEKVLTPRTAQAAPRTVAGLQNCKPEDPTAPAGEHLNWWQASNVHKIGAFLKAPPKQRQSEGLLLCDAPGLGKTLSVLSAVASTIEKDEDDGDVQARHKSVVIIFAAKSIINPVWVEQIHKHFDPEVTGLDVYCADSESAKHEFATPLSSRPAGARGGVYVDERATGRLPDKSVLRSFSVLLLAKEMLTQKIEHERVRDPSDPLGVRMIEAPKPPTNIRKVCAQSAGRDVPEIQMSPRAERCDRDLHELTSSCA